LPAVSRPGRRAAPDPPGDNGGMKREIRDRFLLRRGIGRPLSAALLLPALLGPACREPGNVRRVRVGSDVCREIRIIGKAGAMAVDVLAAVGARGRLVVPALPRELAAIQDVLISPDKGLVLVVSVGEGHPWINVYRIADWMAPAAAAGGGIEPRRAMDPSPYAWPNVGWRSGNEVRFRSEGDYSRFNRSTRRPAESRDGKARKWSWFPFDDRIGPAGR